jgi:pimeloyl-ACP methyl ester carboxylesterase
MDKRLKRMRTSLLMLALAAGLQAAAQGTDGTWKGTLQAGAQKLTLVFHLDKAAQTAKMDVVEQGLSGFPMTVNVLTDDSLNLSAPQLGLNYAGGRGGDKIVGTFRQMAFVATLNLERGDVSFNRPQEPVPPYPYETREVSFTNPSGQATLAGTLTYPVGYKKGKRVPVVLMVTGSGPQNRKEGVFHHRPFLVIADYLARHGIASLTYDDRGTGQSTGDFETSTTQDFADDAACGLDFLRTAKEFSRVGVLGQSEGGGIAYMLGSEGKPDFIVSLAGPACKVDTMMLLQMNGLSRAQGLTFDRYKTVAEVRQQLAKVDSSAWMKYFLDWDLRPYVRATRCPVLALGGETDLNVPVSLNVPELEANLPKNKKNLVKTYPGLSHMLQHNPSGNPTKSALIEETIAPEVLADIATWINGLSQ